MFNTSNMIFFQNYTPSICTEFLTWAYGRRDGERRRKSVRGCIVSQDLSVINLVIVKKGENDLPGLTNTEKPRMRGPKRASKRSGSSSTFPRMTMYASMSTHTAGHSLPRTVSDSLHCHFSPLYLFGLLCIWMPVGIIAVQFSLESRCIIYVSPARPSLRSYVGWTCILTPVLPSMLICCLMATCAVVLQARRLAF